MAKEQPIEQLIADTINDKPILIEFRKKTIKVPRPTLGTLIEVSKHIAKLPNFGSDFNSNNAVQLSLAYAKECGDIPKIVAILMLGEKNFYKEINLFGKKIRYSNRIDRLSNELRNITSQEISEILVKILSSMDCGFFLGIITSLNAINQLKKTKNETTVSGQ